MLIFYRIVKSMTSLKNSLVISKTQIYTYHKPEILLLSIYFKNEHTFTQSCTRICIETHQDISKLETTPEFLLPSEWILHNCLGIPYSGLMYIDLKKLPAETHTVWLNLRIITLSERIWAQSHMY